MNRYLYKLRNWRAFFRWNIWGGDITFSSALSARVIRADGKTIDLGVIARRVVTTVGVKFLCDDFNNHSQVIANFKFHEMGTGTNAEAAADTTLQTAVEARSTGSQASATSGANATYTTVATITATATRAITEHGIFSASSAGTLWDRSVFTVINLATSDSIQFTYVLTANSGG